MAGCDYPGYRDAENGWHHLPEKDHERIPYPIVICSTLTGKGAETAMQPMSAGAVDIITKPKAGLKGFLEESGNHMIHAIKAAGQAIYQNL